MSLEIDPPPPPSLVSSHASDTDDRRINSDTDVHRTDIETALANGAWDQGFNEWAAHTDLDESEWAVVTDLELLTEFDFFWDASADRVGYSSPGVPPEWRQQDLHPALDSWSMVSGINAALSDLGQVVATVLTEDYVDWRDESDPE